jgi:hypothetical protein
MARAFDTVPAPTHGGHGVLLFDDKLLSWLPLQSRVKVEKLDADRAAASTVMRQASNAAQAALQTHSIATSAARDLMSRRPNHSFAPPEGAPPRVIEAYRASLAREQRERAEFEARIMPPVDRAKRVLDHATEAHERATARWQEFAFLENVHGWLARIVHSGTKLVRRPATMGEVTSFPEEVARIRREIIALFDEWRAVEAAPSSPDDYRARAIEEIEDLAARGALHVNLRDRGPRPLGLAQALTPGALPADDDGVSTSADAGTGDASAALWVWLHKDALIVRVSALIDAAPAENAMSYAEREAAFRKIVEKKLALEFLEEATICAAANGGMSIPRRPDCDPRAVLEVSEA